MCFIFTKYFLKSRFEVIVSFVTTPDENITVKKITIFVFAFKKDTSDTFESPAIQVAKMFLDQGAKLNIYNPNVS